MFTSISCLQTNGEIYVPSDGESVTKWIIDYVPLPDEEGASFVDLSDAVILSGFECRYRVYGDTLVSRQWLGQKDWFVVRPDGVWGVGWNDRLTQRRHHRGLPYLPLDAPGRPCSDSVTITNAGAGQMESLRTSLLNVSDGCGFVFAGGDTVRATVLYDERVTEAFADSAAYSGRDRRWYADGYRVPVVQCVEAGDASAVIICPPSEQPAAPAQTHKKELPTVSKRQSASGGKGLTLFGDGQIGDGITVSAGGETVTVSGAPKGADVSVAVYDTAGRMWRRGGRSVSTAALPAGTYIADVSVDGESHPVKFRIDR